MSKTRQDVKRQESACKNRLHAILDEYFPEFLEAFKCPFSGKASMHLLRTCPFPSDILELGIEGVLAEIKKSVRRTVGMKKAQELIYLSGKSVGVRHGLISARMRLRVLLSEYDLYQKQLEEIEWSMDLELKKTGLKESLLSVPGMGVVSLAGFLGETGDLSRFSNGQQIVRLAGFNLRENSSGKSKSGSSISKRGRKNLRRVLYQIATVMSAKNAEMKQIYKRLRGRDTNPLKRKQAMVAISCRIARMLFSMARKGESYNPDRVVGNLKAA